MQNLGNTAYKELRSDTLENTIQRQFVSFRSFDGTTIPAVLFIPPTTAPKPAILVLPGHVSESESGLLQTAGFVESYQHGNALALAKAGFVTMAIEFRGFGLLGKSANANHASVVYNAILAGSSFKQILVQDIRYALGVLQSLPAVDSSRIGLTGVSYGGEMTATYAALDTSIKTVVIQGFGTGFGAKGGVLQSKWKPPDYCHIIPGQNKYLRQEDYWLLIVPRPMLIVRGVKDKSVHPQLREVIAKAYSAVHASSSFDSRTESGGHEYFLTPAITFFKQHL